MKVEKETKQCVPHASSMFLFLAFMAALGIGYVISPMPFAFAAAPITNVKTSGFTHNPIGVLDCFTVSFDYASTAVKYIGLEVAGITSTTTWYASQGEFVYNGASFASGCITPSAFWANSYVRIVSVNVSLRNAAHAERGYEEILASDVYPIIVYSSTSTYPVLSTSTASTSLTISSSTILSVTSSSFFFVACVLTFLLFGLFSFILFYKRI